MCPRSLTPCGSAPGCGHYTPRISRTHPLICRRIDCDRRGAPAMPSRRGCLCRDGTMYAPAGVKTSTDYPIPDAMKAWVLGDPGELSLREKPVPVPKRAEVLVRIDAVAICATDLEIIYHGPPALIRG